MAADSIYALSSGGPPAAIAVIRISGGRAHAAATALAGSLPAVRQAAVRTLRDSTGDSLDEALVLCFRGPSSATGEDLVELHCHGGRAVVNSVLAALRAIEGLREAQPGEFTRRAFENGRIDLTAAEGLADLLEAETESQRRAALLMAEGRMGVQIEDWRIRLLALSARAEAAIDYVGEDSVAGDPRLDSDCRALASNLGDWLSRPRSEPLREGLLVVIAGPPNAGKSSLLNAIVGQDRALVSDIPGTTRDHIEVPLALSGTPVRLTDTAGLRDSDEQIERMGVDRARSLIAVAEVVVWLGEPEDCPDHPHVLAVQSKSDLPGGRLARTEAIRVSAITGEGLPELTDRIVAQARSLLPVEGQLAINMRQAECLAGAYEELCACALETDIVIAAEHLRMARSAIDRLTGRAGVEDMLDSLFGRFCLGK